MITEKIIDYVSWAVLFVAIGLLRITSRYVENIVFGKKFVINYLLAGLVLYGVFTYILYKIIPTYFEGGEKRASAILSQLFSIVILTIFINAFYCFHTGKQHLYYKNALVTKKGSNLKTGTQYLHLIIDGREERFNPQKSEYESLSVGDTATLTMGVGQSNHSCIYEFKKKQ